MNFLANILNGINKKDKNEMTVEKAVKIFKNNKENLKNLRNFIRKTFLRKFRKTILKSIHGRRLTKFQQQEKLTMNLSKG